MLGCLWESHLRTSRKQRGEISRGVHLIELVELIELIELVGLIGLIDPLLTCFDQFSCAIFVWEINPDRVELN